MAIQDSRNCLVAKRIKTDTASTDAFILPIPFTGSGYIIKQITVYNSKLSSTGATANGATASLSIRGTAGGAGTSIFADAALTGLTGSTIVLSLSPAATALTPIVTDPNLYIRVGTASGVALSLIDVAIEYSVLP